MSTIDNLKATIGKKVGLATPNRFNVIFSPPTQSLLNINPQALIGSLVSGNKIKPANFISDPRDISLLCETVSIPSRNISTFDYQADKQQNKFPYTFIDDDVTMSFLLTNDYYMRNMIESWMSAIFDVNTYQVGYKKDYSTDIVIQQLNSKNVPVYGVKLEKAFPINISAVELSQGALGFVRTNVTFAFDRYVPEGPVSSTLSAFQAAF